MLLRNLNATEGLCNGTRLIVDKVIESRLLAATIASPGKHQGNLVLIPRINLQPEEGIFPYRWQRRQFPVRAAFAMSGGPVAAPPWWRSPPSVSRLPHVSRPYP